MLSPDLSVSQSKCMTIVIFMGTILACAVRVVRDFRGKKLNEIPPKKNHLPNFIMKYLPFPLIPMRSCSMFGHVVVTQDVDPAVLQAAFRHIDLARQAGQGCLVHCKAGTSRSCSLVVGYLMQLGKGMSLIAALEFCQSKRRQVGRDSRDADPARRGMSAGTGLSVTWATR